MITGRRGMHLIFFHCMEEVKVLLESYGDDVDIETKNKWESCTRAV